MALQYGTLDLEVLEKGWIGFPFAYVFGMCCDWFVASKIAKGVAFGYLLKPQDPPLKKILCISGGMVVCMVILMSFYGACEAAFHTGAGGDSLDLAAQHSTEFYHGVAVSVFNCRSSGAQGVSEAVPGGNGTGLRNPAMGKASRSGR